MKKGLIIFIVVGIIGIVLGCTMIGLGVWMLNNNDSNGIIGGNGNLDGKKLKVTAEDWSGWSEDYKSTPKEFVYDIELNKEINLNDSYKFGFEIIKITDTYITIKTNQPMSDSETGINLNSRKTEFNVEKGKKIKLTTPTMDAGGIYEIEVNI